jgi:hypothetical protein
MEGQREKYGTEQTNTVVVHGPQASGKTQNAERIRKAYGCKSVIDGWEWGQGLVKGALHLANGFPPAYYGGDNVHKPHVVEYVNAMTKVWKQDAEALEVAEKAVKTYGKTDLPDTWCGKCEHSTILTGNCAICMQGIQPIMFRAVEGE